MMTVRELIGELGELNLDAEVKVAVEIVEGNDVLVVKSSIESVKFEDDEVIVELG